ncbi:MAG TPA: peptidoglycan-binding protein [Anaeromyxobacteraceae bacterium]|nr:peptidoglycan-binding protein [Anaeromyxobacteraceae bacterium]
MLGIVLAAAASVPPAAVAAASVQAGPADASASAAAIAASGIHPGLSRPSLRDVAPDLATLYPRGAPALLWFEGAGPARALADAVATLARAEAVGLDPRRFDADRLRAEAARAEAGTLPPAERALLDVAVTVEWMRFLRAAHAGLVPRGRAGRDLALPARPLDLVRLVRATAAGAGAAAVLASVEPRHPGYARLREALPRLRSLPATPPIPPLPPGARKLEEGASWDGVPAVRARLLAEGDLPSTSPPAPDARVLDAALAGAIRRFQARHALREDGILGKRTLAELSVPPAHRVRQAELAMERWRWLPDPARRIVVVEVPRAWLWAVDLADPGTGLGMRTVVGAPHGHDTPMFASRITTVDFRPSWVPRPASSGTRSSPGPAPGRRGSGSTGWRSWPPPRRTPSRFPPPRRRSSASRRASCSSGRSRARGATSGS